MAFGSLGGTHRLWSAEPLREMLRCVIKQQCLLHPSGGPGVKSEITDHLKDWIQ